MDFLLSEVTFICAIILFLVLGIFLTTKHNVLPKNYKTIIILSTKEWYDK